MDRINDAHYLFRSSEDRLSGHLAHIVESGDSAVCAFPAERLWLILCRKGLDSAAEWDEVDRLIEVER